jgi:fructokinase
MTSNHTSSKGDATGAPAILVVGECLVDLAPAPPPAAVTKARHFVGLPGGGPANTVLGLARLGVRTSFAGRFSRTGFGPWLRQHLATNGVDLSLCVEAAEPATIALVDLDGQGRASYTFYGPETADWHWRPEDLPAVPRATPEGLGICAVHTGSLATTFEPGATVLARWLEELRHHGRVLVSFDPNVRPTLVEDLPAFRRRVEGIVGSAHLVKASDEDVQTIYPGTDALEAASQWLASGANLVVVTQGASGATALHRSGWRARCAPPPVEVADTIGAGDSFTAALLVSLAAQDLLSPAAVGQAGPAQLAAALVQAVAASAFTCTRSGADPPDAVELAAFVERSALTVEEF